MVGNSNNFISSFIKPFNAHKYILISFLSVAAILGLEVLNKGARAISGAKNKTSVQSTKPA